MVRCWSWMTILLALWLSACASAPVQVSTPTVVLEPPLPEFDEPAFGEPVPVPPVASLFTLSDEQAADFLRYFHDTRQAKIAPHRRIFTYLARRLRNFRYDGATRSATEALAANDGNCLSLALVTTSLARLANIEVAYQRLSDEPIFQRHNNVVLVADHVRSLLFDPGYQPTPGALVLQRPHIAIDYFPDRRSRPDGKVSEATLQSMFYVNLAGEAMALNEDRKAFWLLRAALDHDKVNLGALNSLAVLHRRAGNLAVAEKLYLHALQRNGDRLVLLSNYRALLSMQGRKPEMEAIDRRLAAIPIRNPYDHIALGNDAYRQGRHLQALEHYREALAEAPYLHEAYWRQAVVYTAMDEPEKAKKLLAAAGSAAGQNRDKRLYQAKLQSLLQATMH